MRFGSKFMGTQISTAKAAAAIVGLLIALALSRDVAAQPAELSSAASGGAHGAQALKIKPRFTRPHFADLAQPLVRHQS